MLKRLICAIFFLMAAIGANAQNCDSLIMPFFGNDENRRALYPADKQQWICFEAQASFYESDSVPSGAVVYSITEVKALYGDEAYLPANYVVDLNTLSYYAYNFSQFHLLYPQCNTTICFTTPSSTHPYLVMRSLNDRDVLTRRMAKAAGMY